MHKTKPLWFSRLIMTVGRETMEVGLTDNAPESPRGKHSMALT